MRLFVRIGLVLACLVTASACDRTELGEPVKALPSKISSAEWHAVSQTTVLFGHQSVGYNILEGVENIAARAPDAAVRIVAVKEPKDLERPGIGHFEAGRNTDPESKITDFMKYLDSGAGTQADVAMLKFCYVDVSDKTDIAKLFHAYKQMISEAKRKYPNLMIAHITMPLVAQQTGFGIWLKNVTKTLLGRPVRRVEWNIKRDEFNELLKREYGGKDPIFDLAAIESTREDGTRVVGVRDGRQFFGLSPDYTEDGGHLNGRGQARVAEEFLRFLASLPVQR